MKRAWLKAVEQWELGLTQPHATAVALAVALYFGLVPVYGMKTVLAVLTAWLLRGNKVLAGLAVNLTDVLLPVMPFVLLAQYRLGCWLVGQQPTADVSELMPKNFMTHGWELLRQGEVLLLGAAVGMLLPSVLLYFGVRRYLSKATKALPING